MSFPSIYRQYQVGRVVQSQQLERNSDDLTSSSFQSSQVCLVTTVSKENSYPSRHFIFQA